MEVIIERTIGGYTVSNARYYQTSYSAEYTPFNTGTNIFGQRLSDIMPREVMTKTYYQTRIKVGIAISHQLKTHEQAMEWALNNKLNVLDNPIHSIID